MELTFYPFRIFGTKVTYRFVWALIDGYVLTMAIVG